MSEKFDWPALKLLQRLYISLLFIVTPSSLLKQGMIYIMKYFLSKIDMPPIAPASCFRKKAQGLGMGAGDSGLKRLSLFMLITLVISA